MKKLIFSFAMLSMLAVASFARSQEIELQVGDQKSADRGRISVKFVSIVEDSRCPMNARCIWAGIAKIKLAVSKGKAAPRFIELNLGQEPNSARVHGYTISLESLTQNDPAMMGPRNIPLVATLLIKK